MLQLSAGPEGEIALIDYPKTIAIRYFRMDWRRVQTTTEPVAEAVVVVQLA